MDLEFDAPCPECGHEARWSQGPSTFVWGGVGEYGMTTEMMVDCRACRGGHRH